MAVALEGVGFDNATCQPAEKKAQELSRMPGHPRGTAEAVPERASHGRAQIALGMDCIRQALNVPD